MKLWNILVLSIINLNIENNWEKKETSKWEAFQQMACAAVLNHNNFKKTR